ncbi:MAG: hypothetical protein N3D17_01185, partial [bacterium]|nr:hypothetical protein [bacterium]
MKHFSFKIAGLPVSIKISHFSGKDGTDEFYIAIYPYKIADFITQTEWIYRAYMQTLKHIGIELETAVFCRLFFSDIVNQWSVFEKTLFYSSIYQNSICSVSAICQPPGPVAKISFWAYHIDGKNNPLDKTKDGNSLILKRDILTHYWTTELVYP